MFRSIAAEGGRHPPVTAAQSMICVCAAFLHLLTSSPVFSGTLECLPVWLLLRACGTHDTAAAGADLTVVVSLYPTTVM